MGAVEVDLGEFEVTFDHLQGGVAEEELQLEDVAAVAEKVDRK